MTLCAAYPLLRCGRIVMSWAAGLYFSPAAAAPNQQATDVAGRLMVPQPAMSSVQQYHGNGMQAGTLLPAGDTINNVGQVYMPHVGGNATALPGHHAYSQQPVMLQPGMVPRMQQVSLCYVVAKFFRAVDNISVCSKLWPLY